MSSSRRCCNVYRLVCIVYVLSVAIAPTATLVANGRLAGVAVGRRGSNDACLQGYTRCRSVNKCVHDSFYCDGDNDCGDNSDESVSFCRARSCPDSQVKCDNGQCIDADEFCAEQSSCRDGSVRRNRNVCPDIEPSFDLCLDSVITTCARPFTRAWSGDDETSTAQKIIETSMRDICRSVTEVKQCADNTLSNVCHSSDAAVMPAYYRKFRTDYESFLGIICQQEMNVIDKHKSCLLGVNSRNLDLFGILESCIVTVVANGHRCRSAEFESCMVEGVRRTCGSEISQAVNRHRAEISYLLTYYVLDVCLKAEPPEQQLNRRGNVHGLLAMK